MKNNKTVLAAIVGALVILVGLGYFLYGDVEVATTGPTGNSISFNGTELKEEKNGQLIWSVKAEKISVDQTTKVITLEQVTGTFHKDGSVLTVKAPHGIVYTSKEQKFTSTSKFIYTDSESSLEGDALEGDVVLQKVIAKGHAKLIRK